MNYRVRHTTTYTYEADVTLSHHMLRLRPRNLPRQTCRRHEFRIQPAPPALHLRTDYYGNHLALLTIESSHSVFSVESVSEVSIDPLEIPDAGDTPAWDNFAAVADMGETCGEPAADEFLFDSPMVRRHAELADYAEPSFEDGRPVLESVKDLAHRIFTDFKFDPKATTVATPLKEVLRLRRGVCQDFAHLQIGCLRSLGIPARYVSGYLETLPPPGKAKMVGADASHAWISFFCPGHGWIDVDPTNDVLPSERHITIAWGRDYSDVSPIRGVILGAGDHELAVAVDVTPLKDEPEELVPDEEADDSA